MNLDNTQLQIQIKAQDRFRQMIANISNPNVLTCVMLGDSDINYEMSNNIDNVRIMDAPYDCEAIKYPLIYNGEGKGLSGEINCFARQIDANGNIMSLYNYPTSNILTYGKTIPSLANAFDWSQLTFDANKMGYILFFETLLDNYLDVNNIPQRMQEQYKFTVTFNGSQVVPNNWDIIYDNNNGSLLIGKNIVNVGNANNGMITIFGLVSRFQKTILFNF